MNETVILCIEDNPHVQMFNKSLLEAKGFAVRQAETLAQARESMARSMPSLIILDIHLPDGNGLDFLREIREYSTVPVIALTNDDAESDLVQGLASGCDDYVTKPHTFPVLYARIEALLRRSARVPELVNQEGFSLDLTAGVASFEGRDLLLSPKEFALLLLFLQHSERYMSAEYLYEKVWKRALANDSSALKSAIGRLREKMGGSGWCISWSRNEGYSFERD